MAYKNIQNYFSFADIAIEKNADCQSASKNDPLSASNIDPPKVKKNIIFCSLISSFYCQFLLYHN
ncbi:MAG: hypothetical protein K8R67_04100, partial [Desulfobacteraceae bacterium]|nr:hypothetical protein [Desulfobacteraceae bacterium]